MSFSFGSPSTSSKNTTEIFNDSSTKDNRVAVQNADALTATGGGNYDNHTGANVAGGALTINQTDPNSYGFASHLIDQVFGANATTLANAKSQAGAATAALGNIAQQAAAAAALPAAGSSWKTWAKWAAIVGGAGAVVVVVWRALRRRK